MQYLRKHFLQNPLAIMRIMVHRAKVLYAMYMITSLVPVNFKLFVDKSHTLFIYFQFVPVC